MALETLLGFRSGDSTENINARLSGLIPKGIVRGGIVVPEPASLQIRVKGETDEPWVMVAFAQDGMVIRERSEEHVLPVQAGISNVIVLRAKYLESQSPIAQLEVMTMGNYLTDPEQSSLIRLAAVTPATGVTSVSPEDINMSFRDSIEGFTRRIVRAVVDTKEDLPAVSGFPATADINFIGNTFAENTTITIAANSGPTVFQFVPPISFRLDSPARPGLSRINPSQKDIITLTQDMFTGRVSVLTNSPHGFSPSQWIRISDNTDARANTTWQIIYVGGPLEFQFAASIGYSAISGTGGSVVDRITPALVTARTAPGILHSLITGTNVKIENVTDPTFNGGPFVVQNVIDPQTFEYFQYDYPTRDSGNGTVTKSDFTLPDSAVQVGESADQTAKSFEATFRASALAPDISVRAIGSSLQFEASVAGIDGNSYTLAKDEPGYTSSQYQIVLSSSTFRGGVDPVQGAGGTETVQPGDIYVVLYGEELGTLELWGYDGAIFRNLTSALTSTLLDFHRRNLFINEKHVSENEKAALTGTIGVPSATNRYVTEEDTAVLTHDIAEALQGADGVAPNDSNRFLTEARVRGQRSNVEIPSSQDWVAIPLDPPPGLGDRYIVGESNVITTDNSILQYFNIVRTDSLYVAGGPMEYSQQDFSPVRVTALYVSDIPSPPGGHPAFITANELNSTLSNWSTWVDSRGIFPRLDAQVLGLPQYLWVKLSAIPNNGSATVVYSAAIPEKYRIPNEDMLAGPQRILPAEVADLVNKSKELRFNSGISVAGKIINFPINLFAGTNDQDFTLRRIVSDKMIQLTDAFSLDLATGTGTAGIVESWSPIIPPANQWTRYLLVLTQKGKIQAIHIADLEENAGAIVYGTNLSNISLPSLPFDDGRWAFGSVGIQANGTGTALLDLLPSSLELYPYSSAAKQPWTPIVCGDGVNTFGHFSGTDSFVRALNFASSGATIKLLRGTYIGYGIVTQDDITFEAESGAVLTNPGGIVLSVVGNRFRGRSLRFDVCNVAIDPQPGSSGLSLLTPVFESSVITKLGAPINFTFSPSAVDVLLDTITKSGHGLLDGSFLSFSSTGTLPSGINPFTNYYVVNATTNTFQISLTAGGTPEDLTTQGSGLHTAGTGLCENTQLFYRPESTATWTVTDGSATEWLGDFNSADGIQRAHDAASAGDTILVYPGIYSLVIWTNSNIQLAGQGGGETRIRGNAGSDTALTITGDYNQFDNIILENVGTGIDCSGDSTYNTFGNNVVFNNTLGLSNFIPMKLPVNQPARHYNYHPLISENPTCCVTVGDGISSWGDYNGLNAINQAITVESPGTKISVKPGTYDPITINKDQMEIEGSAGNKSVIQAIAGTHAQCILVNGNYNRLRGLFLVATGNDPSPPAAPRKLPCRGFTVTGSYNLFEKIWWQNSGSDRIDSSRVYVVSSGYFNQFMPHTAAPTGYVSIIVGDGIRSFGDSNGTAAITDALAKLPTSPQGGGIGTGGLINNAVGNQADFTDADPINPITFDIYSDIYRYLTITGATNPENNGTFQVINRLAVNKVRIQRLDALTWSGLSTETDLSWRFLAGSKIWVLPGTYTPFTIQPNINDLEMEAWGAGSDVIISGSVSQSPLLYVKGSRCRIKGFRFSGGIPATGIGIQVQGDDNTFENNKFDCAVPYKIESVDGGDTRDALRNRIYDSVENQNKIELTVATYPSRADFYGKDEVALQAALDYADTNPHIKVIKLGEGTWTFNGTVNVPEGLRIEGSGYKTRILGAALTFAAFTLDSGGFQTVSNIRFLNLQYSLGGTASNVYAYGNWYEAAPIDPAVSILPM